MKSKTMILSFVFSSLLLYSCDWTGEKWEARKAYLTENGVICPMCEGTGKSKCIQCMGLGYKIDYDRSTIENIISPTDCSFCEDGITTCVACEGIGYVEKDSEN